MGNNKKHKILIVDDSDDIRETYVQIFKQRGFEVIAAKDGIEGVDLATKLMPDVILTGIVMPRMDGFKLISTLRDNVDTSSIPIAIISHLGREEDRRKAKEAGIENFIVQGTMTPIEVIEKIENLIHSNNSYKLSFDPYAWDAPRLAEKLGSKNFNCPNCGGKMVLEVIPKKEGKGLDAALKCPKCDYSF